MKNSKNAKVWMSISGVCGFGFFIIANFTNIMVGLDAIAGCAQIVLNVFVFLSWRRGYKQFTGRGKYLALIGTLFPPITATITIYYVLIPAFIKAIS